MKKIILILLLFAAPVLAMPGNVVQFVGAPASSGDSCTGSLIHSWHMEDADVTAGTPAGCVGSGEDSTATFAGGAAIDTDSTPTPIDGSGTLYLDGTYARATFDTATTTLADEVKITGNAYVESGGFAAGDGIWLTYIDGNNRVFLSLAGSSSDISLNLSRYYGGAPQSQTLTTTNCSIGEGEWFSFIVEFKAGVEGNDTYIKLCEADGITCDELTTDKDWGAVTGTTSTFEWGYSLNNSIQGNLDNGKVYDDTQFD